ncbi:MAG: hypothetical protein AAGF31_03315 [Planctomycetota bacterium]
MSVAKVAATVHHAALDRVRGIDAVYRPHDNTEAIEMRLVPAGHDQSSYETEEEEFSARTQPWLVLVEAFLASVNRLPEEGDEIDVDIADHVLLDRRTYLVSRADEPRPWSYNDDHATQLRIESVEVMPHRE